MHRWTVRAARVALVAAAISAAGAGVANADNTTGDHSILGGEQIHIPIIAPIGLFGNHVNLLSSGIGGSRLSGVGMTQADPQPQLDVCGNAISGNNGLGTAACKGDAKVGGEESATTTAAKPAWAAPAHVSTMIGAGDAAVGAPGSSDAAVAPSATTDPAPADDSDKSKAKEPAGTSDKSKTETPADTSDKSKVEAPSDASDMSKAGAPSEASAAAPDQAKIEAPAATSAQVPAATSAQVPAATSAAPAEATAAAPIREMRTSGDNSIAGGNQVQAPVRMPIRICGNAGALGGMATASCEGSASSGRLSGADRAFRTLGLVDLRG